MEDEDDDSEADQDGTGGGAVAGSEDENVLRELPDRAAIEQAILAKRKKEMLAMLMGENEEAPAETHAQDLVPKSW
eukprot:scaffold288328_cov28-Tisochrysis_lutea.AAC.3